MPRNSMGSFVMIFKEVSKWIVFSIASYCCVIVPFRVRDGSLCIDRLLFSQMFSKHPYKGKKDFQYKLKCRNGRCTTVLEPTAISVNRHLQLHHKYTCCLRIPGDDPLWQIAPEVCADLNTFEQKGMFRSHRRVNLGQTYDNAFFPNKLKLWIQIAKFIIKSIKKIASYDRLVLLRNSTSKFRVGLTVTFQNFPH